MSQSIDLNKNFPPLGFYLKIWTKLETLISNTLNILIAFATPFNISHFINAIYQVPSTLNCLSSRCY